MTDIELQNQKEVLKIIGEGITEQSSMSDFIFKLEIYINHLIENDFTKLVNLLYTIDVNEQQLQDLLKKDLNKNSASVIASLIIQRQLKKIETRKQFTNNLSDEEKW